MWCQRRTRKEPVRSEPVTFVGIDAYKRDLHVAMLVDADSTPVTWTVRNEARAVDRPQRKLEPATPDEIECRYEAGRVVMPCNGGCSEDDSAAKWSRPRWCPGRRARGSERTRATRASWPNYTALVC